MKKVERSHKIDVERFYSRNEFTSEEDLKMKLKRYNARYNNIAKKFYKIFLVTFKGEQYFYRLLLLKKQVIEPVFYMLSTTVSSRHLSMQQHPKLIVKNEFVASYGNTLVSSVLGASTLQVAQQPSNFSSLKTVLVVVILGSLLIGIANGVFPPEQVYNCIGLVL